jgi:hypothetical protein
MGSGSRRCDCGNWSFPLCAVLEVEEKGFESRKSP